MNLVIRDASNRIVDALADHAAIIVVGDPGSGKTTGIPVILKNAGYPDRGIVGITESRVIAATSAAEYVSAQLGKDAEGFIGHHVRFDDTTSRTTGIIFMTDGILLRELLEDPDLRKYSVVMVDEAHERSLNIDLMLGLLKQALMRRKDLRVVVASATIDAEKFSRFFWGAPIITVEGKLFDLTITWSPHSVDARTVVPAVVDEIVRTHLYDSEGDILAFVPGEAEIRHIIADLATRGLRNIVTLPAYSALSAEDQRRVLLPCAGKRKIVVATNIAETSITIDGITHVIDSGLVKRLNFHAGSGIESLDVVEHSQAGCDQRAGRAARTQPGTCHRLYTEEHFHNRDTFTEPEIHRVCLAGLTLVIEALDKRVEDIDFVDPPQQGAIHEAYKTLHALGAMKKGSSGLTPVGRAMSRLPLNPRISRMILAADAYECVASVTTIAAFLSAKNIYRRPEGKEDAADHAHARLRHATSDLMTYLTILRSYQHARNPKSWCEYNFINEVALEEAQNIREQLLDVLTQNAVRISTCTDETAIMRAVASGFAYNLFRKSGRYEYANVLRECGDVYIHPSSTLFNILPEWFVATRILQTSKCFALGCSKVEVLWLPELVPQLAEFGECTDIISVLPKNTGITIGRHVIFGNEDLGLQRENISLASAHRMRHQQQEQAREEGWVRLVFTKKDDGSAFYSPFVANVSGTKYQAGGNHNIEEGSPYYCKVYMNINGTLHVTPQFKDVELPPLTT